MDSLSDRTHIEVAKTFTAEKIDHLAVVGTEGVSVVLGNWVKGEFASLPPVDATIINFFVSRTRRVAAKIGDKWHRRPGAEGLAFFVPAMFSLDAINEDDYVGIDIGLPTPFVARVLGEAGLAVNPDFSAMEATFLRDPFLNSMVAHFAKISRRQLPADALLADQLAHGLVIHLGQHCLQKSRERPAPRPLAWSEQRRVREFADAHLADAISLRDLAAVVGWSPFHFARAFRATTGKTPHQWVLELRCEKAVELLRRAPARLTTTEVALTCGFVDGSHLVRAMRRVVGITPRELRAGSAVSRRSCEQDYPQGKPADV